MNEHSELPFMNAKNLEGTPSFMAWAMMPWMISGMMMNSAMTFWMAAARGGLGKSWPLGDSLDHVGDAPAEELIPHEHVATQKFKPKGKH